MPHKNRKFKMAERYQFRYSPQGGISSPAALNIKQDAPEHFECRWRGHGDFGDLLFARTEIRPGFDVWLNDCRFREDVRFSMTGSPASFSFNFCLSGKSMAKYGKKHEFIEMSSGKQGVFYCPDPNGTGWMRMDVPHRQVGIVISPERLRSYFESDLNALHPMLQSILEEKQHNLFCKIHSIIPAMHSALTQLLDCPYTGISRKLFFESRALELLALQLSQLSAPAPKRTTGGFRLHLVDRKRTETARDLLVSRLDDPPGLGQLAREAGMSHPKLNRCFREMYGMTVFEYLRNERLNRAREMLDQGLNVTETAYAVGYDSISHFSKAFKNRFGALPSRCLSA